MQYKSNTNNQQNGHQKHRGWGFTFFGETPDIKQEEENFSKISQQLADNGSVALASFPLATAQVGDRLYIVGFQGTGNTTHLTSMGFIPGRELQVISSTPSGSVIVALQENRIGLGAGMAHKILVAKNS
ncbi:MAG TPA: ferrous iron transport protein A [Cyanobacteria bacterium UBA9273]|nr:ferrous iron transport protein A [Cyanobacteria bacterium UBA9273]